MSFYDPADKSVITQGSAFGGKLACTNTYLEYESSIDRKATSSWRFSVQRVNWALRCLEFDDQKTANQRRRGRCNRAGIRISSETRRCGPGTCHGRGPRAQGHSFGSRLARYS